MKRIWFNNIDFFLPEQEDIYLGECDFFTTETPTAADTKKNDAVITNAKILLSDDFSVQNYSVFLYYSFIETFFNIVNTFGINTIIVVGYYHRINFLKRFLKIPVIKSKLDDVLENRFDFGTESNGTLLLIPHYDILTGKLLPIKKLARNTHKAGILSVLDVSLTLPYIDVSQTITYTDFVFLTASALGSKMPVSALFTGNTDFAFELKTNCYENVNACIVYDFIKKYKDIKNNKKNALLIVNQLTDLILKSVDMDKILVTKSIFGNIVYLNYGKNTEKLYYFLDLNNIVTSLSDSKIIISVSPNNTTEEVQYFVDKIYKFVKNQ